MATSRLRTRENLRSCLGSIGRVPWDTFFSILCLGCLHLIHGGDETPSVERRSVTCLVPHLSRQVTILPGCGSIARELALGPLPVPVTDCLSDLGVFSAVWASVFLGYSEKVGPGPLRAHAWGREASAAESGIRPGGVRLMAPWSPAAAHSLSFS